MVSPYVDVYVNLSDSVAPAATTDPVSVSIPSDIYDSWAYPKVGGGTGHSPVALAQVGSVDVGGNSVGFRIQGFSGFPVYLPTDLPLLFPGSWKGFSPPMDVPQSFTVEIFSGQLAGGFTVTWTSLLLSFCAKPVGGSVRVPASVFASQVMLRRRGRSFVAMIG